MGTASGDRSAMSERDTNGREVLESSRRIERDTNGREVLGSSRRIFGASGSGASALQSGSGASGSGASALQSGSGASALGRPRVVQTRPVLQQDTPAPLALI